jgi:hypothetical protein
LGTSATQALLVTGAARSTARAWLAGSRTPTGSRAERLVELSALVERLMGVMDPSHIAVWLRKPVPALGGDKPLDVNRPWRLPPRLEDRFLTGSVADDVVDVDAATHCHPR